MWFDVIPVEVREIEREIERCGETRFITKGVLRRKAHFCATHALCIAFGA